MKDLNRYSVLLALLFAIINCGITTAMAQKTRVVKSTNICDLCISPEYDKVKGETILVGREIVASDNGRTGFSIRAMRIEKGYIIVSFRLYGGGCVDANTTIYFLFRDGSRLQTISNGSFDCDGHVPLYFHDVFRNEDLLEAMKTKSIETVRISTYKSSVQADFSVKASIELINQLNCLDKKLANDPAAKLDQAQPQSESIKGSEPIEPKTISGGVLNGKAINFPKPPYPPAARAVRASGAVSVSVLVDESGRVVSASAASGHPLLRAAAEQAARGARFNPTLLSGKPVKVSGILTYNFVP